MHLLHVWWMHLGHFHVVHHISGALEIIFECCKNSENHTKVNKKQLDGSISDFLAKFLFKNSVIFTKKSLFDPSSCFLFTLNKIHFSVTPTLTIRDNGVKAIENLMEKKGKFDYILLETTGLADPGMLLSFYLTNTMYQHIFRELWFRGDDRYMHWPLAIFQVL